MNKFMNKFILSAALLLAFASVFALAAPSADPEQCGEHQVFSTCGTACPEHCPTKNAKTGQLENGLNVPCVHICKIGCACQHGFVRDLKRGNACVERALCSAP
ncbi:hypothetical protein TYRP_023355 [Tyrophagus putrescentiae]|nr:hypothetical protein TYRP_023355 [Tyrophagus putrescentiae]